jgi:hypothetical protein
MARGIVFAILIGLSVLSMTVSAGEPLRVVIDVNGVDMGTESHLLARYRYGDVAFKPYVERLFTPKGINVLLDSPPDHVHHHGLMFAVAVDGINCWEEAPTAGHQTHGGLGDMAISEVDGVPSAGFTEPILWTDASGREVLVERRTVEVCQTGDPIATLLTWRSRLAAPEGKEQVTLSGSHYFGLGMRFVRAMDEKGQFRNADNQPGVIFRGEERLVDSRWCAYTAQVDGQDVTVAMFGHPDNPRHPTAWFTMATPFAYMAATMRLHEKPLVIPPGEPLTLRYGVALWDGQIETAEIEAMYRKWVSQETTFD